MILGYFTKSDYIICKFTKKVVPLHSILSI